MQWRGLAKDQSDIVNAAIQKWGLDKSLPEQYLYYLWNLTHGDLGVSFKTKRPVAQDLAQYLPATVELGLASLLFALVLGLPLGIMAAIRAGNWLDHLARFISLLGASMPPFWSGLMALFVFYIPNTSAPIVVKASLDAGSAILTIAALSFIGLGAVPPTPEWGTMISMGRFKFYHWWLTAFPGLAVLSVVLGFNFLGDGLRDAFDPQLRGT